jgi:hypothetical protein
MGIIRLKANKAQQERVKQEKKQEKAGRKWKDPAILHEDEKICTEHSRHYVLNNNTAKSVYYATPINYYDETEQRWKEIDNRLEEKETGYEGKLGRYTTKVVKVGQGRTVSVGDETCSLSWEYIFARIE